MADLSLSLDDLRACLHYDPDTGVFTRKVPAKGSKVPVGGVCGYPDGKGHLYLRFRRSKYAVHRLAWFYVYGCWPTDLIDHINGDRADNRIANLREADVVLNGENQRKARSDSRIGVLGVSPSRGRFKAQIKICGKSTYLGMFNTVEEASSAYVAAKRIHHAGCTI